MKVPKLQAKMVELLFATEESNEKLMKGVSGMNKSQLTQKLHDLGGSCSEHVR